MKKQVFVSLVMGALLAVSAQAADYKCSLMNNYIENANKDNIAEFKISDTDSGLSSLVVGNDEYDIGFNSESCIVSLDGRTGCPDGYIGFRVSRFNNAANAAMTSTNFISQMVVQAQSQIALSTVLASNEPNGDVVMILTCQKQ